MLMDMHYIIKKNVDNLKVISLKDVEEVISIGRYTPFERLKNLKVEK